MQNIVTVVIYLRELTGGTAAFSNHLANKWRYSAHEFDNDCASSVIVRPDGAVPSANGAINGGDARAARVSKADGPDVLWVRTGHSTPVSPMAASRQKGHSPATVPAADGGAGGAFYVCLIVELPMYEAVTLPYFVTFAPGRHQLRPRKPDRGFIVRGMEALAAEGLATMLEKLSAILRHRVTISAAGDNTLRCIKGP